MLESVVLYLPLRLRFDVCLNPVPTAFIKPQHHRLVNTYCSIFKPMVPYLNVLCNANFSILICSLPFDLDLVYPFAEPAYVLLPRLGFLLPTCMNKIAPRVEATLFHRSRVFPTHGHHAIALFTLYWSRFSVLLQTSPHFPN